MKTKEFWRQGEPFVWATGLSLSIILSLTFLLLYVVVANGIGVFWPAEVSLATLNDGSLVLGEVVREESIPGGKGKRMQFKIGNRDLYGLDFKWVDADRIASLARPEDILVLERREFGNFYGYLKADPGTAPPAAAIAKKKLEAKIASIKPLLTGIEGLEKEIAGLNRRMETAGHKLASLQHRKLEDSVDSLALKKEQEEIALEFTRLAALLAERRDELLRRQAIFVSSDGREKTVALADIVRLYHPNAMSYPEKFGQYLARLCELLFAEPRESNTEGGLFPAIFGTIMLIFLMSILSFPLGVIAGIYLREYAREGYLVKLVRIAVNNLAGIPSIVYGIFGLGFFVYGIGSGVDQMFFPERLPTPTFGTGGILWASLTLGLLTVPVVIVATEEALGAIPPGIREGSQALAATKFQTLTRILLPMASPGILTGFILAMARAAGEVAPLMITGVVKLAPSLPLDGSFPYVHLERKFMHLGFHIYDIGFQSPNVEAAKPMIYITTLLLILIVLIMTSTAIYMRNKMRKRYAVADV